MKFQKTTESGFVRNEFGHLINVDYGAEIQAKAARRKSKEMAELKEELRKLRNTVLPALLIR